MTFIIDAHQDIAYNHYEIGRDFLRPALKTRQLEDNSPEAVRGRGLATLGLPDAILGRVALIFSTLYTCPDWSAFPAKIRYETPKQAYQQAMQQLDYYKRLADTDSRIVLVQTQADLKKVLDSWGEGTELTDHQLGLVFLIENADSILEPAQVEEWYEHGVRLVGPAWSETRYAGGTGRPGPLTPLGFELLEYMAGLNMILDLSHLTDEGFLQAVDRYEGLVLASHSNPRRFVETERMLSDDMIRRLAERDGVMGLIPFNRFMSQEWQRGDPKSKITMRHYIDMIDYVCQVTGSSRHVGIGSDWDGGFGSESIPDPFDTIADLWLLDNALRQHGFGEEDIKAILHGNFLRILTQALPN